MATTILIQPEIRNQQADNTITYCYLFEPLRINITDSNNAARKLYVEVERYDIKDKTTLVPFSVGVNSLQRYVEIDMIQGVDVTLDLSQVMIQLHNANVFKIAGIGDIQTSYENMIVSQYYYNFKFTSDVNSEPVIVKKLPILGGRSFRDFQPTVSYNQPLTEFDLLGIDKLELANRWSNYIFFDVQLSNLFGNNIQPTITPIDSTPINTPTGGVLYWKSRLGGWMFWGFDLDKRIVSGKQSGDIKVQMFESTKRVNGDPYVPVDYTSIESSEVIELKSLGLSNLELLAVSGIASSPAVYYASDDSGKLELVKIASSSAPYNNLATGGDFTVTLQSISNTTQKTM